MSEEVFLSVFPMKKIKPYDGMSITADVWGHAHSYHNLVQNAHNLFFHGSGILFGLEVVASDPPDQMLFILPGAAVDSIGQVIVNTEPVAYDLGDKVEGGLYLIMSHREGAAGGKTDQGQEPMYLQDEFLITARPSPSDIPGVELARFTREKRTSAIKDAAVPQHPVANEIDMRYRQQIKFQPEQLVTAAVVYLGSVKDKLHGQGLVCLGRELRYFSPYNLVVDDDVELGPHVIDYAFIVLVGAGKFKLKAEQVKTLKDFVKRGGMLLLESCDSESLTVMRELGSSVGAKLAPVPRHHALLVQPYLFAEPPRGFEANGEILADKGVVMSSFNYGRMWCGETKQGTPSREEIRSAMEWGVNLITYGIESYPG